VHRVPTSRQGRNHDRGGTWAKAFRRKPAVVREVEHMGDAAAGSSVAVASGLPGWGRKKTQRVAAWRRYGARKDHEARDEKARRGMIAFSCSILCGATGKWPE
jgi:hypothetical protein